MRVVKTSLQLICFRLKSWTNDINALAFPGDNM